MSNAWHLVIRDEQLEPFYHCKMENHSSVASGVNYVIWVLQNSSIRAVVAVLASRKATCFHLFHWSRNS